MAAGAYGAEEYLPLSPLLLQQFFGDASCGAALKRAADRQENLHICVDTTSWPAETQERYRLQYGYRNKPSLPRAVPVHALRIWYTNYLRMAASHEHSSRSRDDSTAHG